MNPKKRRILIVVIFIVVAIAAVVGFSVLSQSQNGSGSSATPTPTPTSSSTLTPEEEKRVIAENSSQVLLQALMEGVVQETSQEAADLTQVSTGTSNQDSAGKDATVAMIALTDVPEGVTVEQNIAYLQSVFDSVKEGTGQNWVYIVADPSDFENENILGVIKAYEDSDTPANPAILEVTYMKNAETGALEIFLSATVY